MKAEPDPPRCPVPPEHPPDVRNLVGLAFSGGGIRSASFNLGVLQGLESRGVLWIFDYLSTVSGGGFIGSWWSAWLSREKRAAPAIFPENEELEPGRRADTAVLLSGKDAAPLAPGPPDGSRIARRDDPIHFLRLFSNYLTPKTGVLSPDTWRMLAFYIRGLLFTWVVLLPLLLAAVMFGQTFFMTRSAADAFVCAPAPPPSPAAATAPSGDAAAEQRRAHPEGYCAGPNVPRLTARQARWIRFTHAAKPMAFLVTMYATLAILWLVYASSPWWLALVSFIAVGALAVTKIVPYFGSGQGDPSYEALLPLAVGAGLAAHGAQVLLKVLVKDKRPRDQIGASSQAASNQRVTLDANDYRGMLGKQQATLLELITFAGLLLLLAGFGHDVVNWMVTRARSTIGAVGWSGVAMALISGSYTVYKALPSTHGGADAAPGKLGKILMAIAPPLVLVVLGLALAWLSQALLTSSANQPENDRLTTLVSVATFLGLLQAAFAIVESHRDPALPATVSTFWHRLVPESLLPASAQGLRAEGRRAMALPVLASRLGACRRRRLVDRALSCERVHAGGVCHVPDARDGVFDIIGCARDAGDCRPGHVRAAEMAARDRERPPGHAAVDYVGNSHVEPARDERRGANRWRLLDRTAVDCDPDRVRGLHGVACRSQPPLDPRLLQGTSRAGVPRRVEHRALQRGDYRFGAMRRYRVDRGHQPRRRRAVPDHQHDAEPGRRIGPGHVATIG